MFKLRWAKGHKLPISVVGKGDHHCLHGPRSWKGNDLVFKEPKCKGGGDKVQFPTYATTTMQLNWQYGTNTP